MLMGVLEGVFRVVCKTVLKGEINGAVQHVSAIREGMSD